MNAADNAQRKGKMAMTSISVNLSVINDTNLSISVQNDGKGIPVEMHPKEKLYIPELIFGHLLTGSNFNDDKVRAHIYTILIPLQ